MTVQVDGDLRYHCVQCGRSCTGWNVWLKDSLAQRLKDLPMTLRVIEERGQAFEEEDGLLKMYRNDQHSACGYLTEQKLCSIHSQLGFETKPKACRQFPFLMTELPNGEIRVGASFCCTAVRGQLGPPLLESLPDIEALLREGAMLFSVPEQVEVRPGYVVPWLAMESFEAEFERRQLLSGWDIVLDQVLPALTVESLESCWSAAPAVRGQLPWLAKLMPMALLKPCLYDTDRELWRRIDQGFLGACDLEIPEYGWNGPVAELDQLITQKIHSRFDSGIDAYRQALWFRKAHLLTGSLLAGLLLLWSLPSALRLLTALHACKQQREPLPEDFSSALDTVEMSLVAHSGNGGLVLKQMSHHLMAMAHS